MQEHYISKPPQVKNATDRSQIAESKKKNLAKAEVEVNDLRWVVASKEGRRFLWRVLENTGMWMDFAPHLTDAEIRDKAGRRSIGLWLLSEINSADDKAFKRMQDEHLARLKKESSQ